MSYLRVVLKPSALGKLSMGKYPQGCHYLILEDGAHANLHDDAGLFHFYLGMQSPVNRQIIPAILCVTFQENVTDRALMAAIKPGHYKHGKFEAEVTIGEMNRGPCLAISAKAPTISLVKRYTRQLLAGELEPKIAYGKPRSKAECPAVVN